MRANSNLDERQEQTLLKIEHKGCWLAFWGLLIAMIVQIIIYGPDTMQQLAGEWVVFMVLALYLAFECEKNGIWDRRLKPNTATNFLVSVIAGLVMGGVFLIAFLKKNPEHIEFSVLIGGLMAGVVFVCCFVALQFTARSYKKKLEKLEKEPEEE